MRAPLIGTGLKLNVNVAPIGDYHMADYDFECVFYTTNRNEGIVLKKTEMTAVDSDNYVAILDSADLGSGRVSVVVYAYVPDSAFPGGYRCEVAEVQTDEIIYK